MRDNALYFPYINIPESPWLIRTLLYWDKMCSIVPYDYIANPGLLTPEMRNLVSAELVEQIMPGQYVFEIPNFEEPFLRYVEQWMTKRDGNFGAKFSSVHVEKLGNLEYGLRNLNIIDNIEYPWFKLPTPIANAFMAYLASVLGKLPDINATPLTDTEERGRILRTGRRTKFRRILLSKILPVPEDTSAINIDSIIEFNQNYGNRASKFRERIEYECIGLANIENQEDQYEQATYVAKKMEAEVSEIEEAMKSRWSKVSFATMVPLLGAGAASAAVDFYTQPTAATGAVLSLGAAVYQAFGAEADFSEMLERPLAYVALAKNKALIQ